MSKDVSLVFDVNVEDSTSIMKSQLQGIFDEINKVPHSLRVNIDIDKSSLTESTSQIEAIREAVSSINPQQGFLTYLENINSTINHISSNMLKMPIDKIESDTNATYKSMDGHLNKIRGRLLDINNALSKLTKQFADVDDSNKIFGFSENLEKIKNTLDSISNSFSGVFKGANGDIINFETHLSKIARLMEGMYNKAFVMPSINKDNATGNVVGEQVGQIQGAESEIAKLISVLSDLRNAFNTFIQNGDEGVLNFAGGLVYLNNTLNGITTSVGAVENAIRSMLSNSDGEVLNYTQHLETISSILGEISNKTINTSSLDTDFSFDQNGSSNTEAKNKRRAKSEKELEDAVEQETAAEEKRKITLTQFLTLYEKLVDLENRNTHMTGTDKYSNLVESKNALTGTYNQLKDSLVEIDNILELSSVDEEKLTQAFDRGTIAAKQFKTALPTVSDGVKVQDALKAINSANSVITKFDNADGDKNNTSYGNLKGLVEDLESRVDRTAGAFRELDSTASGAGNKISDIMRKIVIESENLKAETASQVLENKAKKAAEGENALADSVKAENEEEKKRLISLKEFLDLHTNLKNLVNQNTIMDGKSDQYGKAVSVLGEMNEAYNQLITQETNLEDITKVLGEDIVNTFDRGKLAAEQLKAAIPNESDGVKYERVLTKINSIDRLMKSNMSMEITNPAQWEKLENSMNALESLIDRDKNQFKVFGEEGSKGASLISEQMRTATAEMENFKKAIPVATAETNAFNTVAAQVERMGKLLRTNSHLEDAEYYKQLKASMTELNSLLDRTSGKILEIANEAEGEGTKLSNAINKSELSIINFNYEINNTKKEAKEAAVSLEKMLGQMNGWKRSLVSASKQGLTSDNDKDFKKLSDLLALFDRVRAAMKDNPALTMSQALNAEGLSQAAAIEKIMQANIASKDLTRTVINLRNNELSLNATEKERDAILSKSYRLLSSMTAALKNWDRAKTGKTSESYSQIKESSIALSKYIKQLEEGKISVEQFNKEIAKIRYSFESNSAIIKNAGENVRSFGSNLKRVFSSFSMWFSLTSIVMRAYNSMRKMASASIELNDAMTQLKIVTDETDSTYETFGSTLANVAKRTASSISDITTSATTYARLGYSLEDAAKIAEYTAKLQNVGDIQVSDAQDAITAILKAYDGIDANHIEDVMNKLVVTGNNFPISVSQIAEGMNNASSALAAAGNTFEQSVALLTAANTTINLCRVA